MATYVYWFLLALILLSLEMMTGTFYLLIVALSMAVGGVVALFDLVFAAQLTFAAIAGITGIVVLLRWKSKNSADASSQSLDIGQPVKVLTWHKDGTARVLYRGAEWDAALDIEDEGHEGVFHIKEIRGSILILGH